MKALELKTERLVLAPYSEKHDRQTVEWLNTNELRETFGITQLVTLQSHRNWIEKAEDTVAWAIVTPQQGHCGNTLLHCNLRHQSAYFQIYLGDPEFRGLGIGKVVLQLVLRHAFTTLSLHRVWLHTLHGNERAEDLYRSAGFVEEGIERESILRGGRFDNQRRWSILTQEWNRAHGEPR